MITKKILFLNRLSLTGTYLNVLLGKKHIYINDFILWYYVLKVLQGYMINLQQKHNG